jgi:hypothetical protein
VLPEGRDEISQFFAKFPPENFQKQKKKKTAPSTIQTCILKAFNMLY